MTNLNEILNRIKDILSTEMGERKIFDKDVANELGINQTTFATMKKRGKIPYKEILEFCARRKISINWLLFNQVVKSIEKESEKYERIHYFRDIYASAGGGALNYNEDSEYINIDKNLVDKFGGKHSIKYIKALNVLGDSMEPTLKDGDMVFMDTTSKNIFKNGIYIVTTPMGLFIKRVQPKADGSVALVSDNKSYANEVVNLEDIEILGKVVGVLSSEV